MRVYLLLSLLLLILGLLGSADSNECANNFINSTSLDDTSILDLRRLGDITTLPPNERGEFRFFAFSQWIFPSLQFGCNKNLSRIVVRVNTTEGQSPPQLFIWEASPFVDDTYLRINVTRPTSHIDGMNNLIYTFEPALEVTEGQFIGFMFDYDNEKLLSHTIAFVDVGEGNAPVSVHTAVIVPDPNEEMIQMPMATNDLVALSSSYLPIVFAGFAQPEETTPTTPPPVTPSPSSSSVPPSTTSSITTSSTTTSSTPPSQPPPVVVDVGLIAGVVVAVLLLILIVLLTVIIALVVARSRSQQKIYEVPVEPATSNLDNPVYGGDTTSRTNLVNGSTHIYATPSPVTSPHPPQESQLTFSNGSDPHYEFREGYVPPGPNESHYEMEPSKREQDDPEYAQPEAAIQPYEVPLSALQQVTQRLSPTSDGNSQSNKEPIYSVLEEGIYVPTQEERKPYPYSETTIINGTMSHSNTSTMYSELGKKYQGSLQRDGFFQEEDIYWRPASSEVALYDQLSKRKYREIVRQKIQIIKHLGSGQFGTVNMGVWQTSTQTVEVAVKTLQSMASETDKVKFLQEAAIMGQFLHPNVVKLYGVVTVGEPRSKPSNGHYQVLCGFSANMQVMIVLEYMQKGDLRNYLISKRPQPGELVPDDLSQTLLQFCREIASGMNYLANKAFVHRDLAARNILLSTESTCKIGDFGMSRDLEQSNYYITHGGIIPVKWTSPEALNFRKYSTASDVWSFGCVMYEIWSLGHKPFEGFTNLQCMQLVGSGFRLAPPPGCPRPLYELMMRCWHSDHSVRPTFSAIFNMLSHSPSHLLSWAERDVSVHPQVACLGAPLEVSEELYPELQDYYVTGKGKMINNKGSRTADW